MDSYKTLPDTELLSLFQTGDGKAYEQIYYRYWAVLFQHCRKMLRNDEEAKDLVQDIFSLFWLEGKELVLKTTLSAYLYSVLRYKVFNLIDKKKVRVDYLSSLQKFLENNATASTDHLIREKQMQELIEKGIASLPEKMREIFELSRKANLSYKEIASDRNVTDNTVKKQMNNALKILRSKLGIIIVLFFH